MVQPVTDSCTLKLLGIGAMASERYAPAGLLIERHHRAIMIDGGPGAESDRPVEDWLITDERAELIPKIRRTARQQFGVRPRAGSASLDDLRIDAEPVVHTSRATYGYRIQLGESMAAWAAEFLEFPEWAAGAQVMFADAAGWNRPIRFAKGVGGHAAALDVAEAAQAMNVARRCCPCGETDDPCARCRQVVSVRRARSGENHIRADIVATGNLKRRS
jgi:hypothetical protein